MKSSALSHFKVAKEVSISLHTHFMFHGSTIDELRVERDNLQQKSKEQKKTQGSLAHLSRRSGQPIELLKWGEQDKIFSAEQALKKKSFIDEILQSNSE